MADAYDELRQTLITRIEGMIHDVQREIHANNVEAILNSHNELGPPVNELTVLWNDLTMERNDRLPSCT